MVYGLDVRIVAPVQNHVKLLSAQVRRQCPLINVIEQVKAMAPTGAVWWCVCASRLLPTGAMRMLCLPRHL